MGIMNAIIRRCVGSIPGEGVMNCVTNMLMMIRMGRMCSGSGSDRSAQPEPVRLPKLDHVREHSKYAKNSGIWISMGRQLPYMFTFSAL